MTLRTRPCLSLRQHAAAEHAGQRQCLFPCFVTCCSGLRSRPFTHLAGICEYRIRALDKLVDAASMGILRLTEFQIP